MITTDQLTTLPLTHLTRGTPLCLNTQYYDRISGCL